MVVEEKVHHEELVKRAADQYKIVLNRSEQGVYLYLDDNHKVCNKKFAEMLGFKSVKEWADADDPLASVVESDQPKVITAYENATEKMVAGVIDLKVKNLTSGEIFKARMIIVPAVFENHIFALHFVNRV
jgi:hypothetical protein